MTKQQINDAYRFFQKAYKNYIQAKVYKREFSVINHIQNYMIGKNDLFFLLHDGDTAFSGFSKNRYIETDLNSAIRTLYNELNKF